MVPKIIVNTRLQVGNCKEIIERLGVQMLEAGYVKDTYIEAVLQREDILPTGLKTGLVNVAIPHTDVTHVNESAISMTTLNRPVKFYLMEDPSQEIDVDIVFLLAVKEPEEQVQLLKNLIAIFQNEELLAQMKDIEDENSLNQVIKASLELV
ncbi:PTS sugar transporter subunit IIA [Bacillus ginsengihumi]|uniref:PTS sugar transporter subunit IIA n=1 Tax=Heyndrickxia ginsengihumi TaxID=363870 RepID=A0A6M0P3M3_9BACI|nr:PTS sugar transporter subunit IIA [Heyndrickxia ginsengihumi]